MSTADEDLERWADLAEMARWTEALAGIAERERQERGVDEPVGVRVEDGDLLADYGPVKFLVATTWAIDGLPEEGELFESIDEWIAFERPEGPGVLLLRDQAVIDAWLIDLGTAEAAWPTLIERVMHDVEATTNLRVSWHIDREDEEDVFPFHPEQPSCALVGPPLSSGSSCFRNCG
jgi:hypothetical protein